MKYSEFIAECINNVKDNLREVEDYQTFDKHYALSTKEEIVVCLSQALSVPDKSTPANKILTDYIRRGKYSQIDKKDLDSFKKDNPYVIFYIHILLQDKYRTFNKGYFDAHVEEMIKRQVEIYLFFVESYYLFLIICKLINWKKLRKSGSIRCNNFITFSYSPSSAQKKDEYEVGLNIDGFNSFKDFYGDIVLGFYEGETLLYAKTLKRISKNEHFRMLAYQDKIKSDKITDNDLVKLMENETKKGSQIEMFLNSIDLCKEAAKGVDRMI